MSRPINISDTLSVYPSSLDESLSSYANVVSGYAVTNAYANSSSTSACRININTGSGATTSIYFNFDCSSIPNNATITSVTCSVKASISNTQSSRITTRQAQLFSGTTAKGTAYTVANSTTAFNLTTGSWTRDELNNIKLRFYAVRGTSNTSTTYYFAIYGATLTIEYNVSGTAYSVTVSLDADSVASIDPSTTQEKMEGEDYELTIYADSLDDVDVYDNGTDVKNQLVRHTPDTGGSISKTASSFTTGFSGGSSMNFYTSSSSTGNNFNNAVGHTAESPGSTASGNGSWTYVKENSSSTSNTGYADFAFDFSDIPANATITSVQIKCYGAVEDSSQSTSHADITLFSGSTQKGTMQKFTSSTNSVITISDPGTWTRAELQSAKLRFAVGYYGGHIFGITWTVTYETTPISQYYWTYALTNINDDHDIVISEDTGNKYLVTVENTNSEVSNLSFTQRMVTEGNSVTLTFTTSMLEGVILTDNQIDVTNSITSSANQRSYTISNVTAAHTIRIKEKSWHEVVCESLYGSASISTNKSKVYTGGSFTVTVNVSNLSDIDIKDNGSTLQLTYVSNGVYTATISNVTEDHEIIVNEANAYQITAISNTSNATISPSGISSARQGTSKAFTILLSIPIASVVLKDNGQDVTNSIVLVSGSQYQYTISSIAADHTVSLFEIYIPEEEDPETTYHSVTISSINATTSPSNGTVRVEEGDDLIITITPSEHEITLVTDNGVDITNDLVGSGGTLSNATTITTQVSGASYGFALNNSGFYESQNKGVASSAAVARVSFNLPVRCLVTITYINYAEGTYDYGIFGNIDSALGTTYSADSSAKLICNTSAYNTASEQTLTYEIEAGTHFIDIKFRKDTNTDSNNDSLQWKITEIQPLEALEYTYTLTNIEEDHSILLIFGEVVYYTTTAIIDDYGKLNPNGTFVSLPGEQYSLIVIPDGRNYEVTMIDNNRDVTSKLELLDTEDVYYYVYTIKSVTYNHNIVVTCNKIAGTPLYIKTNDSFVNVIQIWKRSNTGWVPATVEELTDESLMFFNSSN